MANDYLNQIRSAATQLGFAVEKRSGHGGADRYVAPDGSVYNGSSSPSEYRGAKNAIADLERISGKKLPKVRAGRSRKNTRVADPLDTRKAGKENAAWHARWDADVARIHARRDAAIKEMRDLSVVRTRTSVRRAEKVLDQIRQSEADLARFGQAYTSFSLSDLATPE